MNQMKDSLNKMQALAKNTAESPYRDRDLIFGQM